MCQNTVIFYSTVTKNIVISFSYQFLGLLPPFILLFSDWRKCVIYTIKELKDRITPVAVKHGLPAVFIFGSYARGDANETSDVDILVDITGTKLTGLLQMGGLYNDLEEAVEKTINLIDNETLEQKSTKEESPWFIDCVNKEKIKIYG
jgi:predicted nucleotidyltransferase